MGSGWLPAKKENPNQTSQTKQISTRFPNSRKTIILYVDLLLWYNATFYHEEVKLWAVFGIIYLLYLTYFWAQDCCCRLCQEALQDQLSAYIWPPVSLGDIRRKNSKKWLSHCWIVDERIFVLDMLMMLDILRAYRFEELKPPN